jgi:hypothetical protein
MKKLWNKIKEAFVNMWDETGVELPKAKDWKTTRTQIESFKDVGIFFTVITVYLLTLAAQVGLILAFVLWTAVCAPYGIWKANSRKV